MKISGPLRTAMRDAQRSGLVAEFDVLIRVAPDRVPMGYFAALTGKEPPRSSVVVARLSEFQVSKVASEDWVSSVELGGQAFLKAVQPSADASRLPESA